MCRRGGSKGGKHPDDYCLNRADLEAKEKAGAMITPAEK